MPVDLDGTVNIIRRVENLQDYFGKPREYTASVWRNPEKSSLT